MLKILKVPPLVIIADKRNVDISTLALDFKISKEAPIFNRNGFYMLNKKAWIEYNGIVIETSLKTFLSELNQINIEEKSMLTKDFNLLETFMKTFPSLVTKTMKKIYQDEKFRRDIRRISRKATLTRYKIFRIK